MSPHRLGRSSKPPGRPAGGELRLALPEHAARPTAAAWAEGIPTQITRGAVMMFEHDHHLAVDGIAGTQVWHALFADAIAGTQSDNGYSYVYVHRDIPQTARPLAQRQPIVR